MIQFEDWGTIAYREAWERQEQYRQQRQADQRPDTLVFCDHPRVFTTGRRNCDDDWQAPPEVIRAAGIDIVESNRGGKITYHGPGQLVGYFIVDLAARQISIKQLVDHVESLLIRVVGHYDIAAGRDDINPGVWVGHNKIAAIGMHVSHGITQHGFALNYNVDLADYAYIIPCGLQDRGVTSIAALTGQPPSRDEVMAQVQQACREVLA